MKKLILLTAFFVLSFCSFAQVEIQWQKCLGGSNSERTASMQQTPDGGYVVVGNSNSVDGDVSGFHGGVSDIWIVKLGADQSIEWQKCLGGSDWDEASSVQLTNDGGYIVVGSTYSNDGDVTGYHGQTDIWIVKLDDSGNIEWQKCLGGSSNESLISIQQTPDDGYIIAGSTYSNNGDVTENHGSYDAWIVKLNSSGGILWQKCLGGTLSDGASSILQTTDGGYILAGYTASNNGDITENHGSNDAWIVKLDENGSILWQKCYGGTGYDNADLIQQTNDEAYIISGVTYSNNGDVIGNHGDGDIWILKIDEIGTIQWQKCYGGSGNEYARSLQQTIGGGYIINGTTDSDNGDVFGFNGISDTWVVKLDFNGNIQWQKCLGGTDYDASNSIEQTSDGGYIVAGFTWSSDGDFVNNHDSSDVWVTKLYENGNIDWQKCLGGSDCDEAKSIKQTSDGGYVVAGFTLSLDGDVTGNHGASDLWLIKLVESNISGLVFSDDNSNGIYDVGETGVAGHLVKLEPGPIYTFTDNDGYYDFLAEIGDYTVSYIPAPNWVATGNESHEFTVATVGEVHGESGELDFAVKASEDITDMGLSIISLITSASTETHYWLTYKNWGSVTSSGTIGFEYDPLLTYNASTQVPLSNIDNTITWDYGPIGNGVQQTIRADFQVPGVEYIGQVLFNNAWITPIAEDINIQNNYDTVSQKIMAAYDPNEKQVSPRGLGEDGYVLHGERLTYTIHFQNTGNAPATTVILFDTLDVNLDIETFLVEANSHSVQWALREGNKIAFTFDNIMLPDSTTNEPESHGFVRYSISPKSGLADYTEVTNTAYIYFDFNPAIVTNTTLNTYVSNIYVTNPDNNIGNQIASIYPNPVDDVLNIDIKTDGEKNISIINVLGQTLISEATNEQQLTIDLSGLDKGLYFINISSNQGTEIVKFVKK